MPASIARHRQVFETNSNHRFAQAAEKRRRPSRSGPGLTLDAERRREQIARKRIGTRGTFGPKGIIPLYRIEVPLEVSGNAGKCDPVVLPIILDPKFVRLGVCGEGALALRRLRLLRSGGATETLLFAERTTEDLRSESGQYLRQQLPDAETLASLHALWIADVDPDLKRILAERARTAKVLVNVEDVPAFCDFHSAAEVRRGELLITISTAGAAPGLASVIRKRLEEIFGPEWAARVASLRSLRAEWRCKGISMSEIARRIEVLVRENDWL